MRSGRLDGLGQSGCGRGGHRPARALLVAGLLAGALLWPAPAPAQRTEGVRRYERHGVRFDFPLGWRLTEHTDGEVVTIWVSDPLRPAFGARLEVYRPAPNGNGDAPRLAEVVEAFRREQVLKAGVNTFAETAVIRKLLGGPAPGRQLRYEVRGATHVAEGYVVRRGRRSFSLWLVFPHNEPTANRRLGLIADSFYAQENPPARSAVVPLAERRSYVGHGLAFQYPAGWRISEQEDDLSITINVDEGPSTTPHVRLLLVKGEHSPRIYDAMAAFRAEVQARHGPTKFNVKTTARALNGERADGATASYFAGGQPCVTEIYLIQSGRRAVVVTLHASAAERHLGTPAFDLLAQTLLVGAWPAQR